MVDLAIASNFARELTEEQFAEGSGRRTQRRGAAPGAATRPSARAEAAVGPEARPNRAARSTLAR